MTPTELLSLLSREKISLSMRAGELVVRGEKKALADPALRNLLRDNKQALIALLEAGDYVSPDEAAPEIPPNRIPPGCASITPEMLPLVRLTANEIEGIVKAVPGGVANVQDIYPLTPLQEGILLHHLRTERGDAYLTPTLFRIDSRSSVDAFVDALQKVIDRHDLLRTSAVWEGLLEPVQVVWRKAPLVVEEVEIAPGSGDVVHALSARFDSRSYRLDLRLAPSMRVCIARDETNGSWVVLWLTHHLWVAGATRESILQELGAHWLGQGDRLRPAIPFRNFVAQARLGVSQQAHESFFKEMLGGVDEPTTPFGLVDVQGDGSGIVEVRHPLPAPMARRIRERARAARVTAASLFHLAWAQVLARISGRDDVVFGTVLFVHLQGDGHVGQGMGMFINTLPVRIAVGDSNAQEAVREVHELLMRLQRHEHASLTLAQRCSQVPAPAPLFSALLNYRHAMGMKQPGGEDRGPWNGVEILGSQERTNYPLVLSVEDAGEGFVLEAQVDPGVDAQRICEFMQRALEQLLLALESASAVPLRALDVLPPAERHRLLVTWNDTKVAYPAHLCIHELFEAQVVVDPDAVAVVCADSALSYGALNEQANRLARHLRKLGIKPDDRVALCVERSLEMVVGILGILKAGAGYVPLDPAYPTERLSYMLKDSAPVAVLTQEAVRERLGMLFSELPEAVPALTLGGPQTPWQAESSENLPTREIGLRPEHLAYVIYTSGSTGQPKGVMIEHRHVVNFICWGQTAFERQELEATLFSTSLNFDLAVYECFVPLSVGGRLEVVRNVLDLVVDAPRQVSLINTVPSAIKALIDARDVPASVRCVNLAGEPLKQSLVREVFAHSSVKRVCNLYGPSETTTYSTWVEMRRESGFVAHVGRPIANTRIYILDARGQPVPVGVIGELHIGGAGVARGYLNKPELTREKFVADPFAGEPGARMYRTGDLARYMADGNIEFLGRNDFQVKIRGHRIELGEIEARLGEHPSVREAVVLAREDSPGDKRLVAYVIGDGLDTGALREHLGGRLPEYMVPAAYVQLPAWPLTPNGKLDRKALPAPEGDAYLSHAYEAPLGEVEEKLARIWSEVLKVDKVGRQDNFFELGGHSLLAVGLMERVRREGLQADVRSLFDAPTLQGLAQALADTHEALQVPANGIPAHCERIEPQMLPLVALEQAQIDAVVRTVPDGAGNVQDIYPLAPMQEGLLFHHLATEQGDPYLFDALIGFDRREKLDAWLQALQEVIRRHDIFRTAVVWDGLPEPVQVVWRAAPLGIEEIVLDAAGGDIASQLRERFNPRNYRLDICEAPLMRAFVARDDVENRWVMQLVFHHMVMDYTGLQVVRHEILAQMAGMADRLPAPMPFRDFVARARLEARPAAHEAFFKEMLADVDEPTAPYGLLDVRQDGSEIEQFHQKLDAALSRKLRERARALGVSAASICHLAWAQVLRKLSGRQDVVFGTVLFGRMQGGEDAGRMPGLFINLLPLRFRAQSQGVSTALKQTHAQLTELLRHEHAPLALAQRCSGVQAPAPLFTTLLNYRHAMPQEDEIAQQSWDGIEELDRGDRTSYPFALTVDDRGEGFDLTVQAQRPVDARRLCGYVRTALEEMVQALESEPQKTMQSLQVVPQAERQQLLVTWNRTQADYPRDQCIHELFEEQASAYGQAVALVFEGEQLSYGELNQKANRLAHYLRKRGVGPDAIVAICVERSLEMVVGLLAILKAGGAYVPLDPAYPPERLAHMLEDSQPVLVLTQSALKAQLPVLSVGVPVVTLDGEKDWAEESTSNPERSDTGLAPHHLAYVIYTSGSTGVPKAVMVAHRGLVNLSQELKRRYGLGRTDRFTQFASLTFDASIEEIFIALPAGASLVLRTDAWLAGAREFHALCEVNGVTVINLPTLFWQQLVLDENVDIPATVRVMVVSGDAVSQPSIDAWFAQKGHRPRLFNAYGPTETTVTSTLHEIDAATADSRSIGKPVANTTVYILDGGGQPVPVGVAGELYIGGAGVARGYLNRPELTAEKFVVDPFAAEAGARMYRTGDLARYMEDGNIEFLGRNDFQVKIRGFRVELEEIEARLAQHEGVQEAVVLAREDAPGDKRLVAYYVGRAQDGVQAEALRTHVQQALPGYMVPAAYVQLAAWPLTSSGKLNRKALPAPEADAYVSRAYEAPQGDVEERLARIWSQVLKLDRVGRQDSFFELGGDSLMAIKLISKIRQDFAVDASLKGLFAMPTLQGLAHSIGQSGRSALPAIGLVSRDGALPLSFAQQRLWFLCRMDGVSEAYHLPLGLRLLGTLDKAALIRSLDRIVHRHEALRTSFALVDGQPVQRIARADVGFALREHDLRGQGEAELERLSQQEAQEPFDLARGPLVRGRLIVLGDQQHVLLVTMHHIVSDGWSIGVLVKELSALYGAYSQGQEDPLPALTIQYADYAAWQRRWVSGELLQAQSTYWKQSLAGASALLELPTDRPRPIEQGYEGSELALRFDAALTAQLKELSRRHGVTLFMTLLAGWAVVLGRLANQQDVVIGTPVANRTRAEVDGLIGFFVNTQAMRMDLSGDPTVSQLLERTKERALGAQQHQDLPFEQVVELVKPARSLSYSPIFQVMFVWQNNDQGELKLPGLELQAAGARSTVAKFDLTLELEEQGDSIAGCIEYATALFDRATVARMGDYLQRVLREMTAREGQAVSRLAMLSEVERHQMLVAWNETEAAYPVDVCVHELFEARAKADPEAVAVVYEDSALSYRELDERANKLAHHLRTLGVKPDDRVALCVERSLEMVVGVLGILKAGGAYVPMDPAYPAERLAYMLRDSAPVVLLTQERLLAQLPACEAEVVCLDRPYQIAHGDLTNPARPNNLAYVIYTSGSTGQPKGVMVGHGSVVNQIMALRQRYALSADERILQFANLAFDMSVEEVFAALSLGGALVLRTDQWLSDPQTFWRLCDEHGITHINLPFAFWQQLATAPLESVPASVRRVSVGGEAMNAASLTNWFSHTRVLPHLFNAYGPTEATVNAAIHELSSDSTLWHSIGRPIANAKLYILDAQGQPVPVGVAGELHIGGVGVARGYLNKPELTKEKFVVDPFSDDVDARMYKTGDLARYRADGNIEFLGRNDHQVKIRGFRIELGEIETRLSQHEGVREAVVLAREDSPGDKRLVAYYTQAEGQEEVPVETLRAHVLQTLPEYMVPAAYVRLQALPLTPNGKLDRKALPAPEGDAYVSRAYEAPQGEVEETLAAIWAKVLQVECVGRQDNFFERGGHSLLAIGLISQVRQALGVEVSLRSLFASATLENMGKEVAAAGASEMQAIEVVGRDQPLQLSFAQQRLWFLCQMEGVSEAYHLPEGLRLLGELDKAALKKSLDRIVHRHEVLRTTFELIDGSPVQRIARADIGFALREHDLRDHDEAELERLAQQEAQEPFDLQQGPLVRGRLIVLGETQHVLLVTMHHIVSDGWSTAVLIKELSALYGAYSQGLEDPLPALTIQYADYAAWQRRWVSGEVLQAQNAYWKENLANAPAMLELPTDRPRPAQQSYAGARQELQFDAALTARLKELSRRHGTTLFMTLLAGWSAVLGRLAHQQDVVIGTPVAHRTRAEVEGLIGFFVNTQAIRLDLSGDPTVSQLLERTKERALGAQQNQDLPFEQVVELVKPARSLSYSPIFQVMFVWQNNAQGELTLPGLELQDAGAHGTVAKFDLTLVLEEQGDCIAGSMEYATALFDPSTVQRMAGYLRRVLAQMTADATQPVQELEMLDPAQRHQLLVAWNDTGTESPSDPCIHELFEAQAKAHPEAVALVYEDSRLSYRQLNEQANRLAHHLRKLGVKPDDRVALCVERSLEMVIGLLGILKAGAAYVPLDPAYPAERLAYMLADSQPVAVLTQSKLAQTLQNPAVPVLALDELEIQAERSENLPAQEVGVRPDHLAYIIYTSGSTGQPKGVMVEHRNVTRLLRSTQPWFEFGAHDVWTLFHSIAFDFSVWEVWGALAYGGQLIVVPQAVAKSPTEFFELLQRHAVSVLNQTPSAFRQLIHAQEGAADPATSLRAVIFGGEALDPGMLKPWVARPVNDAVKLINMYGITETTVHVTYKVLNKTELDQGASLIGCRIPDLRIYILDAHGQPVPIGVAGELHIGGAGVARGYLNRPELTAQRFIEDPFSQQTGARIYKTGDLARYLSDGSIEFLGRNDHQVKIRGFRIELGEIEAALAQHEGVREAVVVAREDSPGDKRLVAYYTPTPQAHVEAEQLREHLQQTLPQYMVPAAYVSLPQWPLTPNGKLDRQALPAPDGQAYASKAYAPPQGETEQALAAIWQVLLKVERVGRHDSFFELGGHSLLVVHLIQKMAQAGLPADVRAVFNSPTLQALAAAVSGPVPQAVQVPANLIEEGARRITPPMLPLVDLQQDQIDWIVQQVPGGIANLQDIYPLAPLQEGILFHHMLRKEQGDAYLLSTLLRFASHDLVGPWMDALQAVVRRHDILRTAVLWEGLPQPVQVVLRQARVPLEQVRAPKSTDTAEWLRQRHDASCYRLDVRQAPMLKAIVAEDTADGSWLLHLMHHHLVDDNTSWQRIAAEIAVILAGREHELPMPQPFRNLVAQARFGVSEQDHQAFFRQMLQTVDEPTAPYGLLDVQGDGSGIEDATAMLPAQLSGRLRQQARQLKVSVASLHHVAWARVVGALSGRQDVVFGTVLFGRMQGGQDTDQALGMFINTLPIRIALDDKGVQQSVLDTHALLAELLHHEHAPLSLAQRCSGVEAPTPLFSALLNCRRLQERADVSTASDIEILDTKERTNYPLTLSVDDLGEDFQLSVQLQRPFDAQRVCGYMQAALEQLVQALEQEPTRPVQALPLLPEAERHQLLVTWNGTQADREPVCIHELFEAQAKADPEAVALVHEGRALSYGALNESANRLARHLRKLGVGPDQRVALCMTRSQEMVVGLLAILKAGGAYVPLDPAYPAQRLAYMLEDSAPVAVLTQTAVREALGVELSELDASVPVLALDGARQPWQEESSENLTAREIGLQPEHLAYVIYTSGSTGQPKGVAMPHRSLSNLFTWQISDADRDSKQRTLLFSALGFDVSCQEIFSTLGSGATLEITSEEERRDFKTLIAILCERRIERMFLPYVALQQLAHAWMDLEEKARLAHKKTMALGQVIVAGEALLITPQIARFFEETGARLCNQYGPTETHVVTSFMLAGDPQDWSVLPPIGRPVANTRIYILDARGQPVPVGVAGELYLGGMAVARGYLGKPDLTQQKFLPDPFADAPDARMYRTGDLARYMPDGNIEFLGRNDHQVKIRGYRIEPGEIEALLSQHAGVREAVVMAREGSAGDKRLVAYYTQAEGQEEVPAEALRAHVLGTLPEYMVPAAYVRLEALPLTPNGKVDRKALPSPQGDAYVQRAYEAPVGEVEETLARIWEEVLQVERVGRHDNFFELGGHSLLVIRAIVKMETELGAEISGQDFFGHATLAALADIVLDRLLSQYDPEDIEQLMDLESQQPSEVQE